MILADREMALYLYLTWFMLSKAYAENGFTHLNRQNDVFLRKDEIPDIDTCSGVNWSSSPDSTAMRGVNL